jgi:hypothetical protein
MFYLAIYNFLCRLCPYFDGKHHIEEIMYAENIRRSQLLTVLDKYREILITSQHEDPGISAWLYGVKQTGKS